jgi:hypothetical protein
MRATVAPPTTVNRACYLAAELDSIADAGAGDFGICNGPIFLQKSFCTADQKFSGL